MMLDYISENNQVLIDFIEEQEGQNISIVNVHSIQENSPTSLSVSVSYIDSLSNEHMRSIFTVSVYELMAFVYKTCF